jgi:multiple sugar transport system permease protein
VEVAAASRNRRIRRVRVHLTFTYAWEDFLWPLIITSSADLYTAPLGLALFVTRNRTSWDMPMAGSVIATIPTVLVFMIFQRQFIRGISLSGMKA